MSRWYYAVWVMAEVLLIISVGAAWIAFPEFWPFNTALTVFTLGLGILLVYPRRVDFVTWLQSRQFRTALTQLITFFLTLAIVAVLNHLAWKFPGQLDLTSKRSNTLSAQTLKILDGVPQGTSVTFYARREDWPAGMALLKLFRQVHPGLVLEAVDIEAAPQKAKAAGVQENGTVVLRADAKVVSFILKDELSVTNAFLRLARGKNPKVYFIEGHGEASCKQEAEEGLSAFCQHLRGQLYDIVTLDLQRLRDVPPDADLVIIWGATSGFLEVEVQRLQRWLEKGGSLLWAVSPDFQSDKLANLRGLTMKWGITPHNDLVIDRVSTLDTNEATIPLVTRYGAHHAVTKAFTARTVFPLSASLSLPEPLYSGVAVTPLAFTSSFPSSWAEKDLKGLADGKAAYDQKSDTPGPIALMAVSERLTDGSTVKDTRLGVVGNDVWVRNAYQNQSGNMNLALNLVSWLAHDEGLVSLSRPGLSQDPVILSRTHLHLVFFIAVLTLPVLCFVVAVWNYRRRRRL